MQHFSADFFKTQNFSVLPPEDKLPKLIVVHYGTYSDTPIINCKPDKLNVELRTFL